MHDVGAIYGALSAARLALAMTPAHDHHRRVQLQLRIAELLAALEATPTPSPETTRETPPDR